MTDRAIEAAVTAYLNADPLPTMTEERNAIRAAIRAYHATLAEDDAAVERVADAIVWVQAGGPRKLSELPTDFAKDYVRRKARAAIRAMGGE